MQTVDFSILTRLRFNNADINNWWVNGVLTWVKHTSGAYHLGKTIFYKHGPVRLTKLEVDLDFTAIDAIGNQIRFNLMSDASDLGLSSSENTSAFAIGQTIFVGGVEGSITGINGKVVYYTLLDGTTGFSDTEVTTDVTTGVGTGTGTGTGIGGGLGGFNTDIYQVGEQIYINGRLATIRGISNGNLFIEYNDDGSFETITQNVGQVSKESNDTGFDIGDTIYINGREAVVTGVAGSIITFRYVDDDSTGSVEMNVTEGIGTNVGGTANTTGYNVGDTIYINGRQAIVTGINGTTITYVFIDDNTTGTSDSGNDDDEISSSANTTGYNLGDYFYLNGVRCLVTSITGETLTYLDDLGGTGTINPKTTTGITNTAPNLTGFTNGQTVFVNGVPKIIYSIVGKVITFTDNTIVNTDEVTVEPHLLWNEAYKNYNNSTATWDDPQ